MTFYLRQLTLLAVALSCAPLANADYLWLERNAGQSAKSYFSEQQPGEHLPVTQLQNAHVVLGEGKTAPMKAGVESSISAPCRRATCASPPSVPKAAP